MSGNGRWIKLYARTLDSSVWHSKTLWRIWSWCLLRANPFPTKTVIDGREVQIEAGSFVTGRFAGAAECGLKPSTFWKGIVTLKRTRTIDTKSNNKWTVIIVKNWGVYQKNESEAEREVTAKEQPSDSQVTQNKNIEYRKETVGTAVDKVAAEIYAHYSEKVKAGAKADAIRSIKKRLSEFSKEELLACVDRYSGNGMSKEKQFRIQANNFYGKAERFREYLPGAVEEEPMTEQDLHRHLARELIGRGFEPSTAFTAIPGTENVRYRGHKDALAECRRLGLLQKGVGR